MIETATGIRLTAQRDAANVCAVAVAPD